jgi:DNA-binding NtrC family response regulator
VSEILIIDDDVDVTELLASALEQFGHEVRIAHDGAEGFALVEEHRPDLAIVDVQMPTLSGPELAYKMFIHDRGLEYVPIVFVSGLDDLPQVAASAGTPYFLRKPYGLTDVLEIVDRALTGRVAPHANRDVETQR